MNVESKEVELKLQVPRDCLRNLQAHPSFHDLLRVPAREEMLVSVYFDSEKFSLRDHGISLRVRHVGNRKIQTLKIINPLSCRYFERSEMEQEITGDLPNLDFAADTQLRPFLTNELRNTIKPIFETRVQRKTYRIGGQDSDIEMAVDDGQIVAGNSTQPLSEIELELKRGNPAELFKFAQLISAVVPAQLAVQSKAERGYGLIEHRALGGALADDVMLAPGLSAAEAFRSIGHTCLLHLIANQVPVIERDPKAVHQMRIALRRLRVAISVFSDIVSDDQVEKIKAQLKQFGRELAQARDLEVLIAEVLRPFRRQYPKEEGFIRLNRTFGRQRTKAYKHAAEVIGSDAFRKFVIDCAVWIEAGPWTADADTLAAERARRPAIIHAAEQMSARRKKCRKLGRTIDHLDPGQLHELRIRFKKLRYTAEFFESLYTDHRLRKACKKFLMETRNLQDSLGGLNDVTTRSALFAELMTRKEPASARPGSRQRAFAAGLIVGHQESQMAQLMKRAIKAFSKLDKVKPFWKVPAAGSLWQTREGLTASTEIRVLEKSPELA